MEEKRIKNEEVKESIEKEKEVKCDEEGNSGNAKEREEGYLKAADNEILIYELESQELIQKDKEAVKIQAVTEKQEKSEKDKDLFQESEVEQFNINEEEGKKKIEKNELAGKELESIELEKEKK